MVRSSKLAILAACGAVAGLSSVSLAQPAVVSISGATLLENYLNQSLATVDFIDADGNGVLRGLPLACRGTQQLAPNLLPTPGCAAVWDPSVIWGVQYTAVGSTRGLQELIDNGRTYNTGDAGEIISPVTAAAVSAAGTGNVVGNVLTAVGGVFGTAATFNVTAINVTGGVTAITLASGGTYTNAPSNPASTTGGAGTGATINLTTNVFLSGRPIGTVPALIENPCMDIDRRSSAFFNTQRYITGGALLPGILGNYRNAGGAPVRARTDGTFRAIFAAQDDNSCGGGVTVDAAILDVPVRYAVRNPTGTTSAERRPGQPGYGDNARTAANKDGTATAQSNRLASLTPTGGCFVGAANINTTTPDANTIYDTPLFLATVAPIANFGTNVTQVNVSDLRQLFATGRLPNGQNLLAVTRDSGSGTRNAWDNSIGLDPSFGIGDNVGAVNNIITNDRLGPAFLPNNKNGNPRVEQTVYNHRLAIGYVGPERGLRNSSPDIQWLSSGYCDIPSVTFDLYGGVNPQRPTCTAIAQNQTGEAWFINGPASFGTFGEPRSAPANKGGLGFMEPFCDFGADGIAGTSDAGEGDSLYTPGEPYSDFNLSTVRDAVEPRPGTVPPAMRNVEAAAFINNITRSIDSFEGGFTIATTPGQLAAQAFFLVAAARRVQDPNNPINMVTNTGYSPALEAFILGCNNSLYTAFGQGVAPFTANGRAGKVPARTPGAYSDAAVNAASTTNGNYITESGAILDHDGDLASTGARQDLPLRNLTQGDFNGDGLRNINDAADLIGAFLKRTAAGSWTAPAGSGTIAGAPGADLSIEVLGDFNGDGSYTAADLRYWADGLGVNASTGLLNRMNAFMALDMALDTATSGADNNLFNTILSTGKTYQPGDAAADVVNAAGRSTPGFAPIGEGTVNALDVDYIYNQFKGNPGVLDGAANWNSFAEAITFDLSADITGDLIVDQADIDKVIKVVLGTCFGDVNLDGTVNSIDQAIIQASIATPPAIPTFSNGDINGDNVINAADLALYCPADINCSGTLTVQDIFDFLALYFAGAPKADINGSGTVTVQDIFDFLAVYFAGC